MNRHELRIRLMFTIYQHRLLHDDMDSHILDNFEVDSIEDLDPYFKDLLKLIKDNETAYIDKISELLHNWSFKRLNYVDQAILLVAAAEFAAGVNAKGIIINEAVNIAKKYSDNDSFKYIHGVLDRL